MGIHPNVWPEDTNTNINTEYHLQSHKQTKAQLTCKQQKNQTNNYGARTCDSGL